MRKILLTLILLIVFIPCVNAEIEECFNDYLISASDITLRNSRANFDVSTNTWSAATVNGNTSLNYLFEVVPGKTYYLRFFGDSITSTPVIGYYFTYDSSINCLDPNFFRTIDLSQYMTYTIDDSKFMYTITWNEDISISYMSLVFYPTKGFSSTSSFVYSDFDLSTCPVIEEPIIQADTTLDTFYFIYLDKIKNLASYSLENKFILSAIGIIFLFIILEIILNLFGRGGYKR